MRALRLLFLPLSLAAQGAPTYLERYHEVLNLAPAVGQVAEVNHLVLIRDAGQLTFEHGKLYLFAPLGGRTVGALFRGTGHFTFTPPIPAERAELQRVANAPALDDSISEAVLLFADSTPDQLRGLAFGPADIPGDVGDHMHDLLNSFKGDNDGAFSSDVIAPLLNVETTGFFLARLERAHGGPVLFEIDPSQAEAVRLLHPVGKLRWGRNWVVTTQFALQHPLEGSSPVWLNRRRLAVPRYRLDVSLTATGSANLDFAATAILSLVPLEPIGPWLLFGLDPKLLVDSARWGDGASVPTFKAKDSDDLWVLAPRRMAPGDSATLTIHYHGQHGGMIDREGDWFYIDPGASWWPGNGQGRDWALFDITFHSPSLYPFASIGERTDSSVAGKVMTTHWLSRRPSPFATFNLGLFENYHVQQPGAPPLDVMLSEEAHRQLRNLISVGVYFPQQSHMRENVATDVSNSLKFFTYLFGDPPDQHYYVTEIPFGEGVSFPGMIDLSWGTFQNTTLDGFDEFFRAHEAAHQWWGNGAQPASYRDAWMSEGLASFSALWYLQSVRKHNDEYFKFLDHYEADIATEREAVGPIAIGYRNASPDFPLGYQIMIYEKGAWVFHMLRTLMLDLSTMKEDRFTETMRDYYQSYRGSAATTDDFRQVVEKHAGIPMDWFFDQWVRGTAIPTYHVAWTSQPAAGGKYQVRLRITQEHVPPDFQAFVLVSADLGQNRFAHFRIGVKGGQTEYLSPLLPAEPKGIVFNDLHSVLADVKMERW
jgi:peptidase M1-like protein